MTPSTVPGKARSPALLVALFIAAGLAACGPSSPAAYQSPRAQFGQATSATAPNALGEPVSLAQFSGKFVWVDYAAEWCSSCRPQSSVIRSLAGAAPDSVVFVTIMTSEPEGYGHPATPQTAARWADSMSLDPARVLAADLTSLTLPRHTLFSPQGTEVYRHTGQLSAAEIRRIVNAEGGKL